MISVLILGWACLLGARLYAHGLTAPTSTVRHGCSGCGRNTMQGTCDDCWTGGAHE